MKDMNYVSAVARIRANENNLLTDTELDRMITAKTYDDALHVLADKGWPTEHTDCTEIMAEENDRLWTLIRECAPDFNVFSMFLVSNDFHNLKAILKGNVTGTSFENLLLFPVITPVEHLKKAVAERQFAALPEYMQQAAEQAYDALAHTGDGQFADIRLDSAMLESILLLASQTRNAFLVGLAEQMVAAADLRIAARGSKTSKDRRLLDMALVTCNGIDRERLLNTLAQGLTSLADYLDNTPFSQAAAALREDAPSLTGLEKWCDNAPLDFARKRKYDAFGVAPLASYILCKQNEIKTARIILSAKYAGIPDTEIRRRVRDIH